MTKPIVYIETTIPSSYFDIRTSPEAIARRSWTRDWWDNHKEKYSCVSSEAVMDELSRGEYPIQESVLEWTRNLSFLPFEETMNEIVEIYIRHKVMPNDPLGDGLHLAMASYHKCDFLLTWNCKHIANANKYNHIRRINWMMGLYVPLIVTPMELLGVEEQP